LFVAEMKARQASKIRELGHALVDAGFVTLDEQSKVAWALTKHNLDYPESQP
jgi:hypothetical protein